MKLPQIVRGGKGACSMRTAGKEFSLQEFLQEGPEAQTCLACSRAWKNMAGVAGTESRRGE